jgi:Uncharacterized protein conserved in bacteria
MAKDVEVKVKNTYTMERGDTVCEVRVSDEVIAIIAGLAATEVEGIASMAGDITKELISKLGKNSLSKGVKVSIAEEDVSIEISLNLKYGYNIPETSAKVQDKVKIAVENMTNLNVTEINVKIAGMEVEAK